jgi:hypothetical protein
LIWLNVRARSAGASLDVPYGLLHQFFSIIAYIGRWSEQPMAISRRAWLPRGSERVVAIGVAFMAKIKGARL